MEISYTVMTWLFLLCSSMSLVVYQLLQLVMYADAPGSNRSWNNSEHGNGDWGWKYNRERCGVGGVSGESSDDDESADPQIDDAWDFDLGFLIDGF